MRQSLLVSCFSLLAASLAAQDQPTALTLDFGFVNAAGNTSVTSFNFGERLTHVAGSWTLRQHAAALYGRTDGQKSAEQLRAGVRADHAFSDRVGIYGLVGWDRNEFAGISRRFEEGLGVALQAIAEPRTELAFEAGFGATQQRNTLDESSRFLSGRAAGRFKRLLAEKAYVQQLLEFLPNVDQSDAYRIFSETSLVAPLSLSIALKASYVVRYDNVPEQGFVKGDRVLTTGVQVNW